MCVISNFSRASIIDSSQESEDVRDKLEELVPWVMKLREDLGKVGPNEDLQEVERRTQLARLASDRRPPARADTL